MSEPGVWLEEPGVFVLPAEELGPEGLDAEFRAGAERATGLPAAWFNRFDEAWRLYWSRTTALASADPSTWFPPRCQSVVITLEGAAVRPYFQPFHRSSWLLEQSDFDPDVPAEFGAFLILQVERMGLLQAVGPALAANLSYWVQRSVEEVAAFREGARRATRSDAPAYQALAEALPWIRRLTHPRLRPARLAETEPVSILAGSGLEVPKR
ncbi:MAG: hypothetical protein O2816_12860, partial [Planctomycetota bacterium]|nr:hypothetical protein [Planctomycetota bacterium]